jgi:VIT1/CCC1 family predicted Fe2+/Mn2+ transporter
MEKTERQNSAFADYFKEIIYGGIDGIVTTFAVVAGFAGAALSNDLTAQLSFMVVLLFGLANLFADAASMGLGNFLSVRSEKDLYNAKRASESNLIETEPDKEMAETINIMVQKGFTIEQAESLAHIYKTNSEYWTDFMMQHELELSDPRGENEVLTGLATFGSFLVFGSIPLVPFFFQSEGSALVAFIYSSVGTICALIALGLLKWRVIGTKLMPSLIEVVAVGGTAAVLAYIVGTFFSL